jgi:L-asparaginase/Glu-tRNA(Gln) amidotransferase subunit D
MNHITLFLILLSIASPWKGHTGRNDSLSTMAKTTVLIIETGGTVAGTVTKNNYKNGTLGLEKVLEPVDYDKNSITLKFEQIFEGDGVDKSSGFIVQLASYIVRRTAYFKKPLSYYHCYHCLGGI